MNYKLLFLLISTTLFLTSCSPEKSDFQKAKTENTIEAYEKFIEQYPNSKSKTEALAHIDLLNAKSINLVEAYQSFLDKHHDYSNKDEIFQLIDFLKLKENNSITDCEKFLEKYPRSIHKNDILELKEILSAKQSSDKNKLESFINNYPQSSYREQANFLLEILKKNPEILALYLQANKLAKDGDLTQTNSTVSKLISYDDNSSPIIRDLISEIFDNLTNEIYNIPKIPYKGKIDKKRYLSTNIWKYFSNSKYEKDKPIGFVAATSLELIVNSKVFDDFAYESEKEFNEFKNNKIDQTKKQSASEISDILFEKARIARFLQRRNETIEDLKKQCVELVGDLVLKYLTTDSFEAKKQILKTLGKFLTSEKKLQFDYSKIIMEILENETDPKLKFYCNYILERTK